jgi:hypothetical protein
LGDHGGGTGTEDRFGKYFTHAEGRGAKVGRTEPHLSDHAPQDVSVEFGQKIFPPHPNGGLPKKEKISVKKSQHAVSCQTRNLGRQGIEISLCVSQIRMGSFDPIRHRRFTIYGKEFGQRKSTHVEFSKSGSHARARKTRCVLVRSESGLRFRYHPIGIPYMEKKPVKKSQAITSFLHLTPTRTPGNLVMAESDPNRVFSPDMAPYVHHIWKRIRSKKVNTSRVFDGKSMGKHTENSMCVD